MPFTIGYALHKDQADKQSKGSFTMPGISSDDPFLTDHGREEQHWRQDLLAGMLEHAEHLLNSNRKHPITIKAENLIKNSEEMMRAFLTEKSGIAFGTTYKSRTTSSILSPFWISVCLSSFVMLLFFALMIWKLSGPIRKYCRRWASRCEALCCKAVNVLHRTHESDSTPNSVVDPANHKKNDAVIPVDLSHEKEQAISVVIPVEIQEERVKENINSIPIGREDLNSNTIYQENQHTSTQRDTVKKQSDIEAGIEIGRAQIAVTIPTENNLGAPEMNHLRKRLPSWPRSAP